MDPLLILREAQQLDQQEVLLVVLRVFRRQVQRAVRLLGRHRIQQRVRRPYRLRVLQLGPHPGRLQARRLGRRPGRLDLRTLRRTLRLAAFSLVVCRLWDQRSVRLVVRPLVRLPCQLAVRPLVPLQARPQARLLDQLVRLRQGLLEAPHRSQREVPHRARLGHQRAVLRLCQLLFQR